jgi:hypothetical protein
VSGREGRGRRADRGLGRTNPQAVAALRQRLLLRITEQTVPRGETEGIEFLGVDELSEVLDMRRDYDRALRDRDYETARRIRAEAQRMLLASDDGLRGGGA